MKEPFGGGWSGASSADLGVAHAHAGMIHVAPTGPAGAVTSRAARAEAAVTGTPAR